MITARSSRPNPLLAATTLALCASAAVHGQATDVGEIVMYGIDADTDQLLRYNFDTDVFTVVTTFSTEMHIEAMCWIPEGQAKGMYAVPERGSYENQIIRIHPFDGSWTPYFNLNERITGGTGYFDPDLGRWVMMWVEHDSDYLLTMDPMTGNVSTIVPSVANFEGIALAANGTTVYGVTTTKLYKVNLNTGVETYIGAMPGADKVESLAFAFGDDDPAVEVPGVPVAWTQGGMLVAFDDDNTDLLIINPSNADVIRYACSFAGVDVEGIVFMTKATDPLGKVVCNEIWD